MRVKKTEKLVRVVRSRKINEPLVLREKLLKKIKSNKLITSTSTTTSTTTPGAGSSTNVTTTAGSTMPAKIKKTKPNVIASKLTKPAKSNQKSEELKLKEGKGTDVKLTKTNEVETPKTTEKLDKNTERPVDKCSVSKKVTKKLPKELGKQTVKNTEEIEKSIVKNSDHDQIVSGKKIKKPDTKETTTDKSPVRKSELTVKNVKKKLNEKIAKPETKDTKVCKELRNLGIEIKTSEKIDKSKDAMELSKTSICEMVKTKSRISVQSSANRKSDEEKSEISQSAPIKIAGGVTKDEKVVDEGNQSSTSKKKYAKKKKATTNDVKMDTGESNSGSNKELLVKPDNIPSENNTEVVEIKSTHLSSEPKNKSKVKMIKEKLIKKKIENMAKQKTLAKKGKLSDKTSDIPRAIQENTKKQKTEEEKSKISVKNLQDLIDPNLSENKILVAQPTNDIVTVKEEIQMQVCEKEMESDSLAKTDEIKNVIEVEKECNKTSENKKKANKVTPSAAAKRKYMKKSKKDNSSNKAHEEIEDDTTITKEIVATPLIVPQKSADVKDIYDFNDSGNNSDSIELSNLAIKSKSSRSTSPITPIYKRKFGQHSSIDKPSSSASTKDDQVEAAVKKETEDSQKIDDTEKEETVSPKKNIATKEKNTPVKNKKNLKSIAKLKKELAERVEKSSNRKSAKNSTDDDDDDVEDDSDASTSSSSIVIAKIKRPVKKSLKSAAKSRRMKYFGFWSGPKRHRMASLNAQAKVQCLYENESRAHEFGGFSKPASKSNYHSVKSKQVESSSEEDRKKKNKKAKEPVIEEIADDNDGSKKSDEDDEDNDENLISTRTLRYVPGLRGAGKLWEDDLSLSSENEDNSDHSYKQEVKKTKKKKKKVTPKSETKVKKEKEPKKVTTPKKPTKATVKRAKSTSNDDNSDDSEQENNLSDESSVTSKSVGNTKNMKKRRRSNSVKSMDFKDLVVRKRMASLNASAILSATYEVERHFDQESENSEIPESDDDSIEEEKLQKKIKDVKNEEESDDAKEQVRPVSTSVVIVQDTDVTITGVYVNSSLGSSQEAYCKMQYRVQSSVTEERVLRPTVGQDQPPKSYTPLSALSSMRPPGAQQEGGCQATNIQQPQPMHHQPMPPQQPQYQQIPSTSTSSRCESPSRYHQPPIVGFGGYHQAPYPPPPPSIVSSHPAVSAFCAPHHTSHHSDNSGYYQPAGPLISSHLLPPQPPTGKNTIPTPLDSDPLLQQPPQSTSAAESTDSDVLITGSDLNARPQTFRYAPQPPGPYSRPPMHQMHCPTYPANYYPPYSQHPQDMCYSPPYQPYYPKVYPSYRRYIPGTYYQVPPSELYDSPPSTAPPPSGSQIVPAGPSVGPPQHMDHYPGPPNYYGYSPGGAQCYTRGMQPYMEAPPYANSCPCPMQSCPKNVHTGPLIGSNASKGPVPPPSHLANNTITSGNSLVPLVVDPKMNGTCKLEESSPILIKPEVTTFQAFHETATSSMSQPNASTSTSGSIDRKDQYESVVLAPQPNFSVNSKILEPENSVSPARGSTGLPTAPPTQTGAAQPSTHHDQSSASGGGSGQAGSLRKARIGKPMVREMQNMNMMAFHVNGQNQNYLNQPPSLHSYSDSPDMIGSSHMSHINVSIPAPSTMIVKHEIEPSHVVKLENVKQEEEKDDVIILDKSDSEDRSSDAIIVNLVDDAVSKKNEPSSTVMSNKRKLNEPRHNRDEDCNSIVEISSSVDEDNNPSSTPPTAQKRRKLLNMPKSGKSPLKSYKSLIKRTDPKSYLCTPKKYSNKMDRVGLNGKIIKRLNGMKNGGRVSLGQKRRMMMKIRKVVMIPKNSKRMKKKKVKPIQVDDDDDEEEEEDADEEDVDVEAEVNVIKDEEGDDEEDPITETKSTRRDMAETESKSMEIESSSVDSPQPESTPSPQAADDDPSPEESSSLSSSTTSLHQSLAVIPQSKHVAISTTINTKNNNQPESNQQTSVPSSSVPPVTVTPNQSKQGSKKSKSKQLKELQQQQQQELLVSTSPSSQQEPLQLVQQPDNIHLISSSLENNNNSSLVHDNNNSMKLVVANEQLIKNINNNVTPLTQPPTIHSVDPPATDEIKVVEKVRRNRSRTRKFSNKKRHRVKHVEHVEEVLIPRKSNIAPKWSNGWSWEGEPFQGKVFLNSDDPPVLRTCYPAMRHAEGDIIEPRDCVLLRAGGKKFELPYVAKVAHLWENPEDGEMMMSLLWYYRPEHTEQGRQQADAPDEVFASRHKDHNSVACIEDKCYVLTFSEYCRYRRDLKAYQEGIEELPSIVPPINCEYTNCRPLSPNTSPELVMFCRRVYEFRLKRLMKTPN